MMRTIHTDRLTLEPQTSAHAEAMFVILNDPGIYEYENTPPSSVDWLRERFSRLETRTSLDGREQWLNWVIRLSARELVGYVQATVHADGRAAIAYVLASQYWGRGIAREAVRAMIGELVERHGVRRLTAVLKRDNVRSLRLLERLGFQPGSAEAHTELGVLRDESLLYRQCADIDPAGIDRIRRATNTNRENTMSAVDVVQRQVEAYNDRDLHRFVANYSNSVAVFRMPSSEPSISGKAQFADFYATQRFNLPDLRAEIVSRIVLGNKVIDHERVWGVRAGPMEVVAVYEVAEGLIERVWFFSPE
jgi:[ribosomal protein S5]-alanine N-acetyltransferase